jgi:DHA1 family multidrug resistance protein-like MFS transporter
MVGVERRGSELREWQRNLWTMWIAQTLSIVGFSFTTPFTPLFLRELGIEKQSDLILWSGAMNAGSAIMLAVTAPLWGAIADRYGRKPMVLRAMIGGAVVIGLMCLAPNAHILFALRVIQGALTGTVTASVALVASITPRERLGFSLGLMQTAVFSGSSFGPLLGGIAADTIGYRLSFLLTAGFLGFAGLLVFFLVHEKFDPPLARAGGGRAVVGGMFAPLGNRLILAMVVTLCLLSLGTMAISPLLAIFVEQLSHNDASVASLAGAAFGVTGLTNAIAAIAFGRLADRLGQRRILIGCSLAAGFLATLPAFVQTPPQLIVARGLYGIASGGMLPTANTLIADVTPPESRGAVYGLTSAASSLGSAIGPFAGATLAAIVSIRVVFLCAASVLFFISGWVWRMLGRVPAAIGTTQEALSG